eukprot:4956683-Amphidinium_carterae.1
MPQQIRYKLCDRAEQGPHDPSFACGWASQPGWYSAAWLEVGVCWSIAFLRFSPQCKCSNSKANCA